MDNNQHQKYNYTNPNPSHHFKQTLITALAPCIAELFGLGTDFLKQAREALRESAASESTTRPLQRTLEQLRLKKEIAVLERELHDPYAGTTQVTQAETNLIEAQASLIEAQNRKARAAKAAKETSDD